MNRRLEGNLFFWTLVSWLACCPSIEAAWAADENLQAVFEDACLANGRDFPAIVTSLTKHGWHDTTSNPTGFAADLARIGKSASVPNVVIDQFLVFQHQPGNREQIAILTSFHIEAHKSNGCQLYDPSAAAGDFPTQLPNTLDSAVARKVSDGISKFAQWKRPKSLPGFISVSIGFVEQGGELAGMLGFTGLSMSATAEVRE